MGLFNFGKKNSQENQAPSNPTTMLLFRVIGVGYVLWLWKDLVKLYLAGGADAPSLKMVIITGVFFWGIGIWLLIVSFRFYKKMKAEYDAYNDRVAEEYRLEEEAKEKANEDYEEVEEDYEEYFEEETEEVEETEE